MTNAFVRALNGQANSLTYNGARTHFSSSSVLLDLFFLAGASRNITEPELKSMVAAAFAGSPDTAVALLLWARDIRGGAGERRFFRVAMEVIYDIDKKLYHLIAPHVAEFGRADDLFYNPIVADRNIDVIAWELEKGNGLFAKWLPRKGMTAALIRNRLNMSPKKYRKTIVNLSNTVEQKMSKKEWADIKYSGVPSVAMKKYRKAFFRNDESRFSQFISSVEKGDEKMNAEAIFPHQIIARWRWAGHDETRAMVAQWLSLPNFMEGNSKMIIPVCDTSGSMTTSIDSSGTRAIDVAMALTLYIAERNEGALNNKFITFSTTPEFVDITGSDIVDRLKRMNRASWHMSTNVEAMFRLILDAAVTNNLKQDELPDTILILSDMEFDYCTGSCGLTNFQAAQEAFSRAGYKLPNVVFWNLKGRIGNVPVKQHDSGAALVSGFSPSILTSILSGVTTPMDMMLKTLQKPRYSDVVKSIFSEYIA